MAMVVQRTEDELPNETEDDSHLSEEKSEVPSSRSSSRNSNHSKRSSPGPMPQYQYSKDELMELSSVPLSQKRPECLELAHNNSSGKWDPEKWFVNKRGDKPAPIEESRTKRERPDVEITLSHKRRTSDPRERVKEDKDEIILSPQRRSFGTGCHVIQQSFNRRSGSPTDGRDSDNFRDSSRRIGSGRIINRDREQRDWDLEHRDYRGSGRNDRRDRDRFDQDELEKDSRRYSNSRYGRSDRRMRTGSGHDQRIEEEPEWFSGGPTSQSETIELVGFEDSTNSGGEAKKSGKKSSRKGKDSLKRQVQSKTESTGEKQQPAPPTLSQGTTAEDKKENVVVSEQEADAKSAQSSSRSPASPEANGTEEPKTQNNVSFDLEDLFRMDWIPGLLPSGETGPENTSNNEITCSRFTQWFQRESPSLEKQSSGINEAHMLGSPTPSAPSCSESYFAPISPALHSGGCSILPPHPADNEGGKNLLEILQCREKNAMVNGEKPTPDGALQDAQNIKELEADLKRIVLGNTQSDTSAFNKLLQHMSDTAPSSISMGPMDKSKALQEEDLLQNILGQRPSSPSRAMKEPKPMSNAAESLTLGNLGLSNNIHHQRQANQQFTAADMFTKQLQEQQRAKQFAEQMSQMFMMQQQQQNQQEKGMMQQRYTADSLAKILDSQQQQQHLSPNQLSPRVHPPTAAQFSRPENQTLNAMMQQQRQLELMSSMVKQHQQQQQINQMSQNQPPLLQSMKCPTTKDFSGSVSQTLGLPPQPLCAGQSPSQSPLPAETHGSVVHSQGRIPSPLVFGQQPPALSHAPAPIHPNHLAQSISQNSGNANTLQVQNAMVLQRVPSPQELAVHTQSILQNALIKRKLEEQKENFRKRQEAQRGTSPNMPKTGSTSPLKGLSPTIAFTPTSVMRKMHSEKVEQKPENLQNGGNKQAGLMEQIQAASKQSQMPTSSAIDASIYSSGGATSIPQTKNSGSSSRAVYGQCMANPIRGQHPSNVSNAAAGMNATFNAVNMNPLQNAMSVNSLQGQGRAIVKGGNGHMIINQNPADIMRRGALSKPGVVPNKMYPSSGNTQFGNVHSADRGASIIAVNKFLEQQRLLQQKSILEQCRQSTSPMPPVHGNAGGGSNFSFGPRGHAMNPSVVRPVNIPPAAVAAAAATPNLNIPLLRTVIQANPTMRAAQSVSINQLRALEHLAAMQIQRGVADNNQMAAAAQARNYHNMTFQQLLLNSQNPVAAQAQAAAPGIAGAHGDGKHTHLMPGQSNVNRQSPVNLTKWFGNDVLKQKMPEMPPVSHQKALRLEDVERQQQHSTAVHN